MTLDARILTQLRLLFRRHLCPGGNGIAVVVPATDTTVDVPLAIAEQDTEYGVVVTPDWLTTVRVTSKTATQFTVDFGTAAPGGGGLIDYIVFRQE